MERKRNEESLPETQGFVHHNVVERYTPNGARYALRRDILPAAKRYVPNGAWIKTPHPPQAVPLPQSERQGVSEAVNLFLLRRHYPFCPCGHFL